MSAEETFAKRMRQQRMRLGWSQAALASALRAHGISLHFSAIAKMEAGTRVIRLNEAVAISGALGVGFIQMPDEPTCEICLNTPPVGFTCQNCGAS